MRRSELRADHRSHRRAHRPRPAETGLVCGGGCETRPLVRAGTSESHYPPTAVSPPGAPSFGGAALVSGKPPFAATASTPRLDWTNPHTGARWGSRAPVAGRRGAGRSSDRCAGPGRRRTTRRHRPAGNRTDGVATGSNDSTRIAEYRRAVLGAPGRGPGMRTSPRGRHGKPGTPSGSAARASLRSTRSTPGQSALVARIRPGQGGRQSQAISSSGTRTWASSRQCAPTAASKRSRGTPRTRSPDAFIHPGATLARETRSSATCACPSPR